MRQYSVSQLLSHGGVIFGGLLIGIAVLGSLWLYLTGRWLGAYLFVATIAGVGIGIIGLGLFRYAFE